MRIAFYTLGCKTNQYETNLMTQLFKEKGHKIVPFNTVADIYIVNTCSVTAVAEKKSKSIISKAKVLAPNCIVCVTGCFAQLSGNELSKLKDVDLVVGNTQKERIVDICIEKTKQNIFVDDISKQTTYSSFISSEYSGKTRAFIKIEDGCNNFCSYCIIPFARGPVRSRKVEHIIDEVKNITSHGPKEIVLTGIHLTSYELGLVNVIERLQDLDDVLRIRLGSLELNGTLDSVVNNIPNMPKLCSHFHISMQSGCDSVLSRMNRRYSVNDYINVVDRIRSLSPYCAITTDIIVGFPGESEQEFIKTCDVVKKIGFAKVHIFPFSKRQGTAAFDMPDQIDSAIIKRRVQILSEIASINAAGFSNSMVNQTVNVLFETKKGEYVQGHSENYQTVRMVGTTPMLGNIYPVKIRSVKDGILYV